MAVARIMAAASAKKDGLLRFARNDGVGCNERKASSEQEITLRHG
jgi:hypothetical protein